MMILRNTRDTQPLILLQDITVLDLEASLVFLFFPVKSIQPNYSLLQQLHHLDLLCPEDMKINKSTNVSIGN